MKIPADGLLTMNTYFKNKGSVSYEPSVDGSALPRGTCYVKITSHQGGNGYFKLTRK